MEISINIPATTRSVFALKYADYVKGLLFHESIESDCATRTQPDERDTFRGHRRFRIT